MFGNDVSCLTHITNCNDTGLHRQTSAKDILGKGDLIDELQSTVGYNSLVSIQVTEYHP